jgi:hypothetical protein
MAFEGINKKLSGPTIPCCLKTSKKEKGKRRKKKEQEEKTGARSQTCQLGTGQSQRK